MIFDKIGKNNSRKSGNPKQFHEISHGIIILTFFLHLIWKRAEVERARDSEGLEAGEAGWSEKMRQFYVRPTLIPDPDMTVHAWCSRLRFTLLLMQIWAVKTIRTSTKKYDCKNIH